MVFSFFQSQTAEESPKIQLNILNSRRPISEYGSLSEAMGALGYEINSINISYSVLLSDSSLTEKIAALKQLAHSLQEGKVHHIPDFLAKHVKQLSTELLRLNVHGIFVPPTGMGSLFSSMVKHLESDKPKTRLADDSEHFSSEIALVVLIQEVSIILAARQLSIPVLGSCHGAQLLWYMHGGELYSLPTFTYQVSGEFSLHYGEICNPKHLTDNQFETSLKRTFSPEIDYESDDEEEDDKDYDHNLIMVGFKEKWGSYQAKEHPVVYRNSIFSDPVDESDLRLPEGTTIAKSFEHPGCIGLQWHPHRNIDTKSSIHYLHQFGQQCARYKVGESKIGCTIL